MKKIYSYLLCAIGIQTICTSAIFAQETALSLSSPSTAVIIDGNNKEWGDSLAYYNSENKLNYVIANDKQNIYLVIKTNDLVKQNYILSSGVTFSIDTKGRSKKSAFTVTFPKSVPEEPRRSAPTLAENKQKVGILNFRKISVKGFKDINDEEISLPNIFDIKVAVNFDSKGYMIYEEAIPLELFNAAELTKNEWSYNIKLNPPAKPESMGSEISTAGLPSFAGGRGNGGGRSGGGRGAGGNRPTIEEQKPIDFWGKLKLAQ
ncbi:MAG: hypothetical protein EOP47_00445 [Sphingobacteriaceae bacterium]|nr:MAG: hypothetical protein EOP47_00445 [Sphingobacteriaceae bacterium]